MLHRFLQIIQSYSLQQKAVLLAVSGGIDSVVLTELSRQAGLTFGIAHCNFGLRDKESNRDEAFVKELAAQYKVPFFAKQFDTTTYAQAAKLSIQEAARNLRYAWFDQLRTEQGFAYTLLAHHADDNIETLLMNFFRGSGLDGLIGMPAEKGEAHCLRPMLAMRRSEIEAFAKAHNLAWVEDSSNASDKYTRNFFRHAVLPQLKIVFPQVEENLLGNIQRLQQTQALYQTMLADLKKKMCEVKGEEVHIPILKLLKYKHSSLIYEIIHDFGFGEGTVGEVLKLAEAESGRYIANDRYRIIRHRRWFIIAPLAASAQTVIIEKADDLVHFGEQTLRLKRIAREKFRLDTSPFIAQLDAKEIDYPLVLRRWKTGDYFYPLGMRKKKKLSRFFIDNKLSKTEKEKVWVLESHKRIVWVVGHRIDDRFKVSDATQQVLLLTLER